MKRKIAAILAALAVFLAVPASAEQISNFEFEDEWVAIAMSGDRYFTVYQSGDSFTSEDGELTAYLRQGERYFLESHCEGIDEPTAYQIATFAYNRYVLYNYSEKYGMLTYLASTIDGGNTWRIFNDTNNATVLLTGDKLISKSSSIDYAIYGSNFFLISDNAYLKCPITVLSTDAFMLEAEQDAETVLFMIFIRSSLFEQ